VHQIRVARDHVLRQQRPVRDTVEIDTVVPEHLCDCGDIVGVGEAMKRRQVGTGCP
jgi:hypothetical protein